MRAVLTVAAASIAAIALPASAAVAQSFASGPGPGVSSSGDFGGFASGPRDGTGFDGRRHRRSRNVVVIGGGGGWNDAWALYNNRSFEPDSYNDWWHDRPDRAFPRWMQSNQNCERMWWGGGGWRC